MSASAPPALRVWLSAGAAARWRDRTQGAFDVLGRALARGFPPGAVAAITDREETVAYAWGGWAKLPPRGVPVRRDTVFDLASLTKQVITASLAVLLVQQRRWSLDDPVSDWLPAYPHRQITLRHCLTHTSGLVPHRPFFRTAHDAIELRSAVFREVPLGRPGATILYSDLNYMLLGWALSACAGRELGVLARDELLRPLGMRRTAFCPPRAWRHRIAATERDGEQRLRPGLVWGEVLNGNARRLGGVAGHAGLFSTAGDLARFARALLQPDRHPVLSAGSIRELTTAQAGTRDDRRGLGWRLDPRVWGPGWPPSTYWHTGATGTSLLVAPELGVAVVLLTNAVHWRRDPRRIAALRTRFHRAVAAGLRPR